MRDESIAAAEGVAALSAYRRAGAFGAASLVSGAGYGGFKRGSQVRSLTGGTVRTYTHPQGSRSTAQSATGASSGPTYIVPSRSWASRPG